MGIDVRILDESGNEICCLLDPRGLTRELLPDFQDMTSYCLRFIDPHGDTVFNQHQIPVLITEIERALQKEARPEVLQHGKNILELANQAMNPAHLYVKFYGD